MSAAIRPWDSGRRDAQSWRDQIQEIQANRDKLERARQQFDRRYGSRWPKAEFEWYAAREQSLNDERERLIIMEEGRFEPYFPSQILAAINRALHVDLGPATCHTLEQRLWDALNGFISNRKDRHEHGIPILTSVQRKKLQKIRTAAERLERACGPDVATTQRLIGNWAEGFLNGSTAVEVIRRVALLRDEVELRLRDRPAPRHRQKNQRFQEFCTEVALALKSAGEKPTVYRQGALAKVLRLLLSSAAQPVPRNLIPHLQVAVQCSRVGRQQPIARRRRRTPKG